VDEERRRKERRARGASDPEACLEEALAHRRSGELEAALGALSRVLELERGHAPARALLLLTEVGLGRRPRGVFAVARVEGIELARFLDATSARDVARVALDPKHGPVDAEAVAALAQVSREGALALLEALGEHMTAPDRLRVAVGMRFREIARWGIEPAELSERLRAEIVRLASSPGPLRSDAFLLAGAVRLRELRPVLESARESLALAERRAAGIALELMASARPEGAT
jgi:hypothetical protein